MFSRLLLISAAAIVAGGCMAADASAGEMKTMSFTGKSETAGKFVGGATLGQDGKDGWVGLYDESGTVSGFTPAEPRHKLHCFGTVAGVGGVAETHGFCDEVDSDGDHMLWKSTPEMRQVNTPPGHGMSTIIAATGKYAGATGWGEFKCVGTGGPDAYQNVCENQGAITLPK